MTLLAGSRLGPYVVGAQLGAGGMGEVYRAKDTRLDRDVAVKVLPEGLFADADLVGRFEREAKALAALNHPGIAAIHAFEEVDGRHLLVQELLEGETLRQVLASGKPPLRKTLDFAVQIARALAAAHDKGVVHRDLKPENLFVTHDGRVKILDFGLAKVTMREDPPGLTNLPTMSKGTEPGVVLGTMGYMSPEQVRGQAADQRSDIFSFGAVLYEMLSGKKAFTGDSAADTMSAILKEDPPDLAVTMPSVAPGLERVVRHCLEKSPVQRFQSAHDLAFDIEALSAVSGSRISTSTAGVRSRQIPSRAVVAALCATLAVGFLAGWLVFRARPVPPARFQRLTFRRGLINAARFAPDGQTAIYSAAWDGASQPQLFSTRFESPESTRLSIPSRDIRSVSRTGEMLLLELTRFTTGHSSRGTLSQASISGSAARNLMEDVGDAAWAPDGTSFAVVRAPDWHYRLEFPAGKVLYQTTGWISYPRVSPSGNEVAFLDHPIMGDDRGALAIVDRNGKKTTLSTGWESVQGVAWPAAGDEVWFTATNRGNARSLLAVTRTGRLRTIASTPSGLRLEDISRDGRVLLVESTGKLGIVGVVPGESKERDLGALDWTVRPTLSDDGKLLVMSEEADGGGPGYSVYMRRLDGGGADSAASAAVRLGEGEVLAVSPDSQWVLAALVRSDPPRFVLIPTGAGEPRPLPADAIARETRGLFAFFPDGKRLLFVGHEPGRPNRTYVQDLAGGAPHAVTREGEEAELLSPDTQTVVVRTRPDERLGRLSLAGGTGSAQPIAGAEPGDVPIGWAEDKKSLFVRDSSFRVPARIYRIDGSNGQRTIFREFTPADATGLKFIAPFTISPDGKTVIFQIRTYLSTLYLGDALR